MDTIQDLSHLRSKAFPKRLNPLNYPILRGNLAQKKASSTTGNSLGRRARQVMGTAGINLNFDVASTLRSRNVEYALEAIQAVLVESLRD